MGPQLSFGTGQGDVRGDMALFPLLSFRLKPERFGAEEQAQEAEARGCYIYGTYQ